MTLLSELFALFTEPQFTGTVPAIPSLSPVQSVPGQGLKDVQSNITVTEQNPEHIFHRTKLIIQQQILFIGVYIKMSVHSLIVLLSYYCFIASVQDVIKHRVVVQRCL